MKRFRPSTAYPHNREASRCQTLASLALYPHEPWMWAAWNNRMTSKSDTAWRTAARLAALAEEADDDEEREYYIRMRDAWITLANRCEFMPISDVTDQ
jgi:hypothetical protein